MSRSEETGTLKAKVGCMFKCWWAYILKLLSFLWIGIVTRFHEKYSDFFRNFFLTWQNGKCFSPEIGIQKASLVTFPHGNSQSLFIYFSLLHVCEQKGIPLIVSPEHSEYGPAKIQNCNCGWGCCNVDS